MIETLPPELSHKIKKLTAFEAIPILKDWGLTIIDSIKVLRNNYELSLGESKELVSGHPVWVKEVKANEPLHRDAIQVANQSTNKKP